MTWKVGRVWWPERPRLRRTRDALDSTADPGWIDFPDFADGLAALAVVLAVIGVLILLVTVVFPIIVLGLEILVLLILFLAGVAGRFLFGVPWTVRAKGEGGRELTWRVKGFGTAGLVRDEVADALARGDHNPRPADALPA